MKKYSYMILLALLIAVYLFLLCLVYRSSGFASAAALFISNMIANMVVEIYGSKKRKRKGS